MTWDPGPLTADDFDSPTVCMIHRRFVPCRHGNDDCATTDDPTVVALVRDYQQGKES